MSEMKQDNEPDTSTDIIPYDYAQEEKLIESRDLPGWLQYVRNRPVTRFNWGVQDIYHIAQVAVRMDKKPPEEVDFDALWDKIRDAIYETPAVDGLLSDLNWEEAGLIADSVIKVLETNNKEATND